MSFSCNECGETWEKHPVILVPCPQCQAPAGAWCRRPSGHRAMDLHVDREHAALREGHLGKCAGPNHRPQLALDFEAPARATLADQIAGYEAAVRSMRDDQLSADWKALEQDGRPSRRRLQALIVIENKRRNRPHETGLDVTRRGGTILTPPPSLPAPTPFIAAFSAPHSHLCDADGYQCREECVPFPEWEPKAWARWAPRGCHLEPDPASLSALPL